VIVSILFSIHNKEVRVSQISYNTTVGFRVRINVIVSMLFSVHNKEVRVGQILYNVTVGVRVKVNVLIGRFFTDPNSITPTLIRFHQPRR
jgi:hypothetical protein